MSFIICKCPECGTEVDSDEVPQPLRLFIMLSALMVHVGLIDDLMDLPEYKEARAGWDDRLDSVVKKADQEIEEMAHFGEAFDGQEDDD